MVKEVVNANHHSKTEDADVAAMYDICTRSKQENLFGEDLIATVCFVDEETAGDAPPRLTASRLDRSASAPPLSSSAVFFRFLQGLYCQ